MDPRSPGNHPGPDPRCPGPARTPAARLVQMRNRWEFSGHTIDMKDTRWDLRFLPQPFYRYESTDPEVVDGALFAFVSRRAPIRKQSSSIEARRPSPGTKPVWQSGYARFTDKRLRIYQKGIEVFSASQIIFNTGREDKKHRYRLFTDRTVEPIEGQP